jgi:hypothetical protein
MKVKVPSDKTLEKYGLTRLMWRQIVKVQSGVCRVCAKLPKSGRLCIDHEHVKGWAALPPEERHNFVRGLICYRCNRFRVASNTRQNINEVVRYLYGYLPGPR